MGSPLISSGHFKLPFLGSFAYYSSSKGEGSRHPVGYIDDGGETMTAKQMKVPGPDHPIAIQRNPSRVIVSVAGRVIADTREALTLREADYPAVQYVPRRDVDMSLLARTDHATYCPFKGDCAYYSIPVGGERSVNAVWTYEEPYASVDEIKNHVAFYPDRVDSIEERGGS
jgi:uncharacterized protein (DUF427 family)